MTCLFKYFAHFLKSWVVFFLLNCRIPIVNLGPWTDTCIVNIFSQSSECLFTFLMVPFFNQETVLNFNEVQMDEFFSVVVSTFCVLLKKCSPPQGTIQASVSTHLGSHCENHAGLCCCRTSSRCTDT